MNIWCFRDPFPFYHFPFSFLLVSCCPWGKGRNDSVMDAREGEVAMIEAWMPLSPKYSKRVGDRVALFPVAFGTHMGCYIE